MHWLLRRVLATKVRVYRFLLLARGHLSLLRRRGAFLDNVGRVAVVDIRDAFCSTLFDVGHGRPLAENATLGAFQLEIRCDACPLSSSSTWMLQIALSSGGRALSLCCSCQIPTVEEVFVVDAICSSRRPRQRQNDFFVPLDDQRREIIVQRR